MDPTRFAYKVIGAREGLFEGGKCCVIRRKNTGSSWFAKCAPAFVPCSEISMENSDVCSDCYREFETTPFTFMYRDANCPAPDVIMLREEDEESFRKGLSACDAYGILEGHGMKFAICEEADGEADDAYQEAEDDGAHEEADGAYEEAEADDDEDGEEGVMPPESDDDEDGEEEGVMPPESDYGDDGEEEGVMPPESDGEDDGEEEGVMPPESDYGDEESDGDEGDGEGEDEAMTASPESMQSQIDSLQQQVTALRELLLSALNSK